MDSFKNCNQNELGRNYRKPVKQRTHTLYKSFYQICDLQHFLLVCAMSVPFFFLVSHRKEQKVLTLTKSYFSSFPSMVGNFSVVPENSSPY